MARTWVRHAGVNDEQVEEVDLKVAIALSPTRLQLLHTLPLTLHATLQFGTWSTIWEDAMDLWPR